MNPIEAYSKYELVVIVVRCYSHNLHIECCCDVNENHECCCRIFFLIFLISQKRKIVKITTNITKKQTENDNARLFYYQWHIKVVKFEMYIVALIRNFRRPEFEQMQSSAEIF